MMKAEISMQVIVMAIISLVVMIVLIAIFNGQIGGTIGKYIKFGNDAESSAQGNKCVSYFESSPRKCVSGNVCGEQGWDMISPASKWVDCKDNEVCCQKNG